MDNLIHSFLWKLTEAFPSRTRDISRDGSKYLRRFYLTPRRLKKDGTSSGKYLGFGVYLHHFYRGDEDKELHNHPWNFAFSFILAGGYKEYRRNLKTNKVEAHFVKPFTFNVIHPNTFHKVELHPDKKTWTLFVTGKRVQNWGFWNKETNEYVDHQNHVKEDEQGYK